jgi:phage shock protein PspC (stress-responsive transcriptional regulator)
MAARTALRRPFQDRMVTGVAAGLARTLAWM